MAEIGMAVEEIRRQIVLALTDAIAKAAFEGSLKVKVYPIMGDLELRGLPREVVLLSQALEA